MNFKGKRLLLLAGAGPHCKVVDSAHEMGVHVVVTDYLNDSPAKALADEKLMYNIFDVDELVAYGRQHHIDGVLGFCIDPTQKPAQQIAERLHLPTFGTTEQVFALTNKKAFKKLCVETGVDIIPEYTEKDVAAGRVVYPVLVKPVDSRGSRGAAVCRSEVELRQKLPAAKAESSDGSAIIERYMTDNQDLSITYVVKNGEPILVSIGDRYPGRVEDNLNRQLICTIQPSRYADMYLRYVDKRVKGMIRYLGIKNGPVFMQGFVDGDTVRMYDPGIRFPGNEYERITKKATSVDLMKSVLSYVLGGEIDDDDGRMNSCYDLNGKCAIQYMINVGSGKIAAFEGLEAIAKHPAVIDIQQRHFVGDVIESTGDIKHRAGEISVLVERRVEKMTEIIRFIQKQLRVYDAEGRNMLISPVSEQRIAQIYHTHLDLYTDHIRREI